MKTNKLKGSIKLLDYYNERPTIFPQSSVVLKTTSYLVQNTFLTRCFSARIFELQFRKNHDTEDEISK